MRFALLSALLLIDAATAMAQSGASATRAPRVARVPEIIDSPLPEQETPQQRVQRLEAELNQARQAAGTAAPQYGSAATIATPPAFTPPTATPPGLAPPTVTAPVVVVDDSWRYKLVGGTWWYLQPNGRWVYWSGGRWVEYVTHVHVVPHYHPHYDYHGPSIGLFFGHGHGRHHHGHH